MLAAFTLAQALSYPLPTSLARSADGRTIAYAIEERGARSVWIATAPAFQPKEIVDAPNDDGVPITSVQLSRDGSYLVYVAGGTQDAGLAVTAPKSEVVSVAVSSGTRTVLGEGRAPAVAPDGSSVAFIAGGTVWSAPIDGRSQAQRLFYDPGSDDDLQWSPSGDALAFVSSRKDHAFIGIYRGDRPTLQFLAPSAGIDLEPRWSRDGTYLAFARTPGAGGAAPSPLAVPIVPWSIRIARIADGTVRDAWDSPRESRASFPTRGGAIDLTWAGDRRLLFLCERDNWPHLYALDAGGGAARQLTHGAFSVINVVASEDGDTAYYEANTGSNPGDIDRSHLFRLDLASARSVPVTAGASSQWWPTPLAGGLMAYVTATAQRPPVVAVAAADGSDAREVDGALMPPDFPTALVSPREVVYRAPDGTPIHAQLFEPGTRGRGPGIVFVHGGPMRQMLLTWDPSGYYDNAYALNQYLVSRGYTVLSVNYRSGVNYGHDFLYAARTGWTGASEYQDVLAGARVLQHLPAVDPRRIGIWGGSWGGYLTALALARNSDVFKAGVDFAGVHDLAHDAIEYFGAYGEGASDVDLRPWIALARKSSPIGAIARWRSPVLLVGGDQDRDVDIHQLVDLVARLRVAGVPYQTLVLANEAHSFLRWSSWLLADERASAFFDRYLEATP